MADPFWTVPKIWDGATCFIIAGGPSVTQESVDRLKGRKVIAIKLSIEKAPWADYLFFADGAWFKAHKPKLREFPDRVVTCANLNSITWIKKLQKTDPPGLCEKPDGVMVLRTSTTGAINFAVHLGAKNIGILGLDGKLGAGGQTHHHTPHPMPKRPDYVGAQKNDLDSIVAPLKARGVNVFNLNPESHFRMFPFIDLDSALAL